ncbi:hypothetical protein PS9374_05674 [Planomonospora sphaerica]|uniref:Uncharacterized protein n=1 Tax=Planomonospora sphaerica TaxID=161355 RepID=A0A161LKV5_9ACTN|nr:hypothetical protein [Planomonospora sphaerica]GAT69994.1 hypothetical protein PS9374_05674 [Planomonospora sphaerica]
MIGSRPGTPTGGGKPGRRLVLAGVVGILLPVGLFGWAWLMTRLFPDSPQCGHYTGCLGFLVQAWTVGRWVAIVLAWPLLYLLRVRPAWPVALLAALFLATIWRLAEALPFSLIDVSVTLVVFSGVIAYPVAAWLSMPRTPRWLPALSAALLLVVYVSVALFAT